MLRDDVRAAAVARLVALAVIALMSSLHGCGPSFKQIQTRYDQTADACVAEAQQLERECPRGDECLTKLHDLRVRCDADLARICHQSRRAERVCP